MSENPQMELTRSPHLNETIKTAEGVLDGTVPPADLKKSLKKLNDLRRQMVWVFRHQLRFQEKTSVLTRELPRIEENFRNLKAGIEKIYQYFSEPKEEHIRTGLKSARESFEALFASFDALKDEEKTWKVYSRSPYLNELMRVGFGVIKGTIAPEAFKERLEEMITFQNRFISQFENMSPLPAEVKVFNEKKESIKKALARYRQGLEEAKLYFKDKELRHIKKGLEEAAEATEKLFSYQEALLKAAESSRERPCFRCGAQNPVAAKFCIKCNAILPPLPKMPESTFELRQDEAGFVRSTGHALTENTKRLIDAVEGVQNGTVTLEKFKTFIESMQEKAKQAIREKARLSIPSQIREQEDREVFLKVGRSLDAGLQEFQSGIERISLYLKDRDPGHLTVGLEAALSGADRLYQVQVTVEGLKKARECGQSMRDLL